MIRFLLPRQNRLYAALHTRLGISFCMCDLCTVSAAVCGHSNGPVGRSAFFSLSRMKRHWSCFHLGTPRRSTKIAPFFFLALQQAYSVGRVGAADRLCQRGFGAALRSCTSRLVLVAARPVLRGFAVCRALLGSVLARNGGEGRSD